MVDLTDNLKNINKKENKIGRYSTTMIQDILSGKITPELYLKPKSIPATIIYNNFELGRAKHDIIERCLNDKDKRIETEVKKVYNIDDIELVGVADALFPKIVWEFKTSTELKTELNEYHKTQGLIYCSIFEKEKCEFYQPVWIKEKNVKRYKLNKFGEVLRDDKWFEETCEKIKEFHFKLVALNKKL
jgi:hypothetical protein